MAIGIDSTALLGIPCKIQETRLCEHCRAVTERQECPRCEAATIEHPDRHNPEQRYCIDCAEPFLADELRVNTWSFRPYDQDEDGDICCSCRPCIELMHEEQGDPQAVWKL